MSIFGSFSMIGADLRKLPPEMSAIYYGKSETATRVKKFPHGFGLATFFLCLFGTRRRL